MQKWDVLQNFGNNQLDFAHLYVQLVDKLGFAYFMKWGALLVN